MCDARREQSNERPATTAGRSPFSDDTWGHRSAGRLLQGRGTGSVGNVRVGGPRRLIGAVIVGAVALAGCVGGASEGVTTVPIELGDAEGACRAVAQANDLLSSPDSDERGAGEVLAALVWDRSAADDELSNWLRRQCGADSLEMAYDAGLSVNGRVAGDG